MLQPISPRLRDARTGVRWLDKRSIRFGCNGQCHWPTPKVHWSEVGAYDAPGAAMGAAPPSAASRARTVRALVLSRQALGLSYADLVSLSRVVSLPE